MTDTSRHDIEAQSKRRPSDSMDLKSASEIEVDFDGEDDIMNPTNWSPAYKWFLVSIISIISLSVNLAILMAAPATPQILEDFGSDNKLHGTLLVSIWELGEVFGPLVLGPLSELYGRLPVYHAANILFVIISIAAALSTNINMLIGLRFLLGLNVVSLTLNPCIIGDMFRSDQRGKALAIMSMVPYVAPCLGPTIGGFVSDAWGWRWTFWLISIVTGALEVILLFTLRETYQVTILEKKAHNLRKAGKNAKSKFAKSEPKAIQIRRSILRPLKLLVTSPIVILVSLCGSVIMSFCYVVITSMPYIFEDIYKFTESHIGLSYLGLGIGMVLGIISTGAILDWLYQRVKARGHFEPECRLPPMIFGYFMVPFGLMMLGWTSKTSINWIVPIAATFFVGFGFTALTLSSWAYLIDVFPLYAASATAAVTVVRNAAAATVPLAGSVLTDRVGLGLSYTILAIISLVISPALMVLYRYGAKFRNTKRNL